MTTIIVTLDGGEIETGFWGPDVSKIQLGELPLMTTQQFVHYAASVLTERVIPQLDTVTRAQWAQDARSLREQVQDLLVLQITGQFFTQGIDELTSRIDTTSASDKGELSAALSAAVVPTDDAVYYKENPFKVQSDGQRIGLVHEATVRHVIDREDFFNLTYSIVRGGIMGWGSHGTYQEVKEAAAQIDAALNT